MAQAPHQPTVIIDQTEYAVSAASPETIRSRSGSACIVFTVRPGDVAPYDRIRQRPYERAELISLRPFAFGKAELISFMQYIAPGSAASSDRPAIIGQIHNTAGQTERPQPFVAMQVVGTTQRIITFSGSGPNGVRKSVVRWKSPVEAERWVHWIWEFKPDRVETTLQVWRDGVRLFPTALNLGGYDGPRGPYWQFGIYRRQDIHVLRVGYANMQLRPAAIGAGAPTTASACPIEPVR